MPDPDPKPVLDLLHAFRASRTLFAAVRLRVFDHLADGNLLSCQDLAALTGAAAEPLSRLLNACCALAILTRDENGRYANTAAAETYLRQDAPDSLSGYILYSADTLWPLWHHLDDALRQGSPRWSQAFGVSGPLFSNCYRTPEARRQFLLGMHGFGRLSSREVVRVFNLARFRTIADLGGATGHLAIAACERYGHMEGIVFDLPEVVEFAQPFLAASRAAPRLKTAAGDFFRDPLPPADLYALGRILHDWGEDKISALLARIYAALPPGGALLIAETLLDDDGLGPLYSVLQSLNMLVCTEGRERNLAEYAALLEKAGFQDIEARRTGAPLDALLAVRKQ